MHTFEQLLRPGDSEERPVVPGRPDDSGLFRRLVEPDSAQRMPQEDEPLDRERAGSREVLDRAA